MYVLVRVFLKNGFLHLVVIFHSIMVGVAFLLIEDLGKIMYSNFQKAVCGLLCVNPALPNRHWNAEPHDPHEPWEGEVRHVQPVPGGVLEEPVSGRAVVHKDLFQRKKYLFGKMCTLDVFLPEWPC